MANGPCWNCDKRTGTCHDTCEAYLEWKVVDMKMKEDFRRQRRGVREAREVVHRAVKKSLRGGGKKFG